MRILILDLLAERSEFGHGGNIEMVKPFTKLNSNVEVLLITPQYEDLILLKENQLELIYIEKDKVPFWDDEVVFESKISENIGDCIVEFNRILTPVGSVDELSKWLEKNEISCLFCSGSRRNVSQPEPWMKQAKQILRGAVNSAIPTLGICFGHQLLADTLGGSVIRSDDRTDAIYNLELSNLGLNDPLFDGLLNDGSGPIALYTHQDHVIEISTDDTVKIELLGSSKHCENAAIRISKDGRLIPVWGVQFHPEASLPRIERSYKLGHISLEEKEKFNKEHDGAKILENFAGIVNLKT